MYEGKEEIHKHMQYEVSFTVCMGKTTNQRKVPKWLPFKKLQVRITKHLMCIYGGHMYTKYEVPMSNPVAGGGVHR